MNPIQGEKFQDICETQISKLEHKKFESNLDSIDVDNFDFTEYDNSEWVYVNSSLLNTVKPKLAESKLYDKLSMLQNSFNLILHNSDDEFLQDDLSYLNIDNCKMIYTQNLNVIHDRVKPIPIGIANHYWPWGSASILNEEMEVPSTNSDLVYANFTLGDGLRYERRIDCYKRAREINIRFYNDLDYRCHLKKMKQHKYCLSPEGNGIDCHRTWESLYMKTIPICKRSVCIEEFSKIFPIYLVDDWGELNLDDLEAKYDTFDWSNWYLLDFTEYCKRFLNYG